MDVIRIKADLVIELIDGFTGERTMQGNVFAKLDNDSYAMKKDGCLVFVNKPSGLHKITVGGSVYQSREFETEFDDGVKTVTVMLMPSRSYKISCTATKLYGKAGCRASARFLYASEQARILGEYKKGETKVSMFFLEKTPMREQCGYSLGEGAADYSLRYLGGTDFGLDRPLERDIGYDSAVGISYEITPSERGEYFIAVSGSFKTAQIAVGGKVRTIELPGENTEYDIEEK